MLEEPFAALLNRGGECEAGKLRVDHRLLRLAAIARIGPAEPRRASAGVPVADIHHHEADDGFTQKLGVTRVSLASAPAELPVSLPVEAARVRGDLAPKPGGCGVVDHEANGPHGCNGHLPQGAGNELRIPGEQVLHIHGPTIKGGSYAVRDRHPPTVREMAEALRS